MKYLPIFAVAWLFALPCQAQHVTESVLSLKRKFSPLIGSTSAGMTMTLRKDYDVGGRDTVYSFVITVNETELEVQSVSIGFSSFSVGGLLGGGGNAGATMSYDRRNGQVVLLQDNFLKFYKCVSDVYKVTGTMAVMKKNPNTLCTCEVDGVVFGGEYLPENVIEQKFYFRLGEAVFSMTKLEFEDIVKIVRDAKLYLDARA